MEEHRELNESKALFILARDFGTGSGFFVEKDLIATNIHVVAGATSISAKLIDIETNVVIKEFIIEGITAFDSKNDLAILKIAGEGTPLPIGDSDLVQSGDIVQAIGYPNGKYEVTKGPMNSIRDSDKWIRMKIKTDIGNSGGPVLNVKGEVIGVSVGSSDSYSFAIPANVIKVLLAQTQEIEPLAQWQERKRIQAYTYLVQSQIKYFAAKKKHSATLYDEAIITLDKTIQLNPDCALFYHNRGSMKSDLGRLKTDAGNIEEAQHHYGDAVADYTEAIKLCPDYVVPYDSRGAAKSILGQSKFDEGKVKEAQNHYRDAIADYTKAIKLCPDYALAYNGQADVKWHFGKSEDAVGNVEEARSLYQAALIDINTAIELDSGRAIFYHTKGQIQAALGDYSAAIENYEKARGIDPDYTDVYKDLELAKKALEQQKIL